MTGPSPGAARRFGGTPVVPPAGFQTFSFEVALMSERLRKVDHIGIAVPDLDAAIQAFTTLFGTGPASIEDVPDQKVRTAFFAAGETNIELLFPTAGDSPISNFLAKRGAGIHHICFEVANLARSLDELRARGVRLIDETPRAGAHGKRIAFLHPKSTGGILIELCEAPRRSGCEPHPMSPHGAPGPGL